jgi:hypothetical protein
LHIQRRKARGLGCCELVRIDRERHRSTL